MTSRVPRHAVEGVEAGSRPETDEAMRAAEGRLHLALEASGLGTFIWYPDEDRGDPDERMLELFGLSSDGDLNLAKALATMIHPEDRPRYAEAVAKAIDPAGSGRLHEDIRVSRPDGTEVWLAITGQTSFEGEPPRARRMAGVAQDITERKRAEAALRESDAALRKSEEQLLTAQEAGQVGTWDWDAATGTTNWSRVMWRIYGYDEPQPSPEDVWEASLHAEDRPRVKGHVAERLASAETEYRDEFRIVRPDGSVRWLEAIAEVTRGSAGEATRMVGVNLDVTERHAVQDTLRRSEEALRAAQERQAFLLALTDRINALNDPSEIVMTVSTMMGERLGAGRCGFGEMDESGELFVVERDWTNGVMPSLAGNLRIADFGRETNEEFQSGVTSVLRDPLPDAHARGAEVAYEAAVGVRTGIAVPLLRAGRYFGTFYVHDTRTREWSEAEVELVEAVAHRAWVVIDRAKAEARLRENEERQAFLLELSDALRTLTDVRAISTRSVELFGRHLGVATAQFLLVAPDGAAYDVAGTYGDGRLPLIKGTSGRISDHGPAWGPQFRSGEAVFSDDHATRPEDAEASEAFGVRSGSAVPLLENGRLVAILSTGHPEPRRWSEAEKILQRDVTERTWLAVERARAEATVAASEERFRRAMDVETVGVFFFSLHGAFTDANETYAQMTGYTLDELRCLRWDALAPPEYAEVTARVERELAERDTSEPYEHEVVRKDGSRFWALLAVTRLPERGECVAFVVDITKQKENEIRTRYVMALGDALRAVGDPMEIQEIALCTLGAFLGVDRAFYADVDEERDEYVITRNYVNNVEPLVGAFPLSAIRRTAELAGAGNIVVFENAASDPRFTAEERAAWAAMSTAAAVGVPLTKDGHWVAGLGVHQSTPRKWTPDEIHLIRETAERTWAAVERARAEAALRQSDARFREMADAAQVLLWELDENDAIFVNGHYLDFFGVGFDEVRGMEWTQFLHPDDADTYIETYQAAVAKRRPFAYDVRCRRADGQYRWLRTSGHPVGEHRFVGSSVDVTELRESEDREHERTVEATRRQQRLAGEQAERARWARELHDETLQGLAAIQLQLSVALGASGEEKLAGVRGLVNEEIEKLRALIVELRPSALAEFGLGPALETLTDQMRQRNDAEIDLAVEVDHHDGRLPGELEHAVYRIVQEATRNATQHSGASRVEISVLRHDHRIEVLVSDDGSGFDPDKTSGGYGLVSMRERTELVGGELDVSTSEKGTRVRVEIPVS